jgi:hypothetical protein
MMHEVVESHPFGFAQGRRLRTERDDTEDATFHCDSIDMFAFSKKSGL